MQRKSGLLTNRIKNIDDIVQGFYLDFQCQQNTIGKNLLDYINKKLNLNLKDKELM